MQIYEYSYQLTRIKAYVMPYIDIQQKWDRYHEPRANFIFTQEQCLGILFLMTAQVTTQCFVG